MIKIIKTTTDTEPINGNYEIINTIPDNATNGDIIKTMFPTIDKYNNMLLENHSKNILFDDEWWNTPYIKG